MTGRRHYTGPATEGAARAAVTARGGEILTTRAAARHLRTYEQQLEDIDFVVPRRCTRFYQAVPSELNGRYFGTVAPADVPPLSADESEDDDDNAPTDDDDDDRYGHDDEENVDAHGNARGDSALVRQTMQSLGSAGLCGWVLNYKTDIVLGKEIGTGSYGTVHTARWKKQPMPVAVKRLVKQTNATEEVLFDMFEEASNLTRLQHNNVVVFVGVCTEAPNLCIVTEYMARGSLRSVLDDKSAKLPWKTRVRMLRDAARGLAFLHAQEPAPVIHRDVKSSNLLVDENETVKLADLGFARARNEGTTMTRCGTPAWTAPEILIGHKYTEKADVYSFGIVMWEVLTRAYPYQGHNFMQVSIEVANGTRPTVPSDCPADYLQTMKRCWKADPSKRPSMDRVLESMEAMVGPDGSDLPV
jgi:hypothetical protein